MLLYENPSETRLPTAAELPHSDEAPVESELQDKIVYLLQEILKKIWGSRRNWFFGINMAVLRAQYCRHSSRWISELGSTAEGQGLRLSYVIWEENGVIPILAVEVVSKTPGGEYKGKKKEYARLGVKYYIIYAPRRRLRPRLTVYSLENGKQISGTSLN